MLRAILGSTRTAVCSPAGWDVDTSNKLDRLFNVIEIRVPLISLTGHLGVSDEAVLGTSSEAWHPSLQWQKPTVTSCGPRPKQLVGPMVMVMASLRTLPVDSNHYGLDDHPYQPRVERCLDHGTSAPKVKRHNDASQDEAANSQSMHNNHVGTSSRSMSTYVELHPWQNMLELVFHPSIKIHSHVELALMQPSPKRVLCRA